MESRIPVVINGVVSVKAVGSSPGRYSLRMNVFNVVLISCVFIMIKVFVGAGDSPSKFVTDFAEAMPLVCLTYQTAMAPGPWTIALRAADGQVA